jgi:superfamily II RNA helicase
VGDDPTSKFNKTKAYLSSLPSDSREVVAPEIQLFMVECLLQRWITLCKMGVKDQHLELAALIWSLCTTIRDCKHLTKDLVGSLDSTIKTLGLPPVSTKSGEPLSPRKLPFTFSLPITTKANLSVDLPSKEFQLRFCGPYMERSFDSAPDPRVDFHPDGWQRRVLDAIDAEKSVFAVAPTSAGKTFISFYAMRKVLEADDDSVLVYVAPTKALVNQIAAEIQARYSKKFKYGGKSVWAIHTRDYRINNPTGCQVLVTVPHVLQIMLLAPSNANSWSTRVKTIILDEIHSIGQAEDGVVWEQLLLLSPCPIIALSATVGNPTEFSDWLTTTQRAIGVDLETVNHPHRYSDLRKYFFVAPEKFAFAGLPEKSTFGTLGLEHATGINHIHPIAALVDRSRGIPEDLSLEPKDCFELYQAMSKHATERYPISAGLDPKNALPEVRYPSIKTHRIIMGRFAYSPTDCLTLYFSFRGKSSCDTLNGLKERNLSPCPGLSY